MFGVNSSGETGEGANSCTQYNCTSGCCPSMHGPSGVVMENSDGSNVQMQMSICLMCGWKKTMGIKRGECQVQMGLRQRQLALSCREIQTVTDPNRVYTMKVEDPPCGMGQIQM